MSTPSGPTQHHGSTPPPQPRPTGAAPKPTPAPASISATNPALAARMGIQGTSGNNPVIDFNIPADIVVLPSEGLWYPHGKGQLLQQNMTSSEENILMDETRIQQQTEWNDLLTAIIRDADFLPPGQMLPADFMRCLLQARINSFGSEYEVAVIDPYTDKLLPPPFNKVDLTQVKNRPLLHRPEADGTFVYELPMLKKKVRFRLLLNLHGQSPQTKVTDSLYARIVDVDGETNRMYIRQFSQTMPAGDSARLRLMMDEVEPALDPTMTFVSSTTGNPTFQRKISLNDSIFYLSKI
jgi:hypothetical protein